MKELKMLKGIRNLTLIVLLLLSSLNVLAASGPFFIIRESGTSATYNIQLCLNANAPCTCQNFTVNHLTLSLTTTTPNWTYRNAGIKILTPGFSIIGCQLNSKGYCLFSVSDTTSTLVTVTATAPTITLAASLTNLALSVNCTTAGGGCVYNNDALTGTSRQITITNTNATYTTMPLTVSSSGLPSGTSITTDNCTGKTLGPSQTCTIMVTPGKVASSDTNGNSCSSTTTGTAPNPGTITVSTSNVATPATTNIYVLSYGCIYAGGFIYYVNDATTSTQSIGGQVVSQSDQAAPRTTAAQATSIIWSSNGAGSTISRVSNDIIPGIDTSSVSPNTQSPSYAAFTGMFNYPTNTSGTYTNSVPNPALAFLTCTGKTDGSCNSSNILLFYNQYVTNYNGICDPNFGGGGCTATTPQQTPLNYYAAGLCTQTISGYSNWYLPAICEMGGSGLGASCGSSATTGGQNMNNLVFLLGNPNTNYPNTTCPYGGTGDNCLAGYYWSSTERSGVGQYQVWYQKFASGGNSIQDLNNKHITSGVRCVRAF